LEENNIVSALTTSSDSTFTTSGQSYVTMVTMSVLCRGLIELLRFDINVPLYFNFA